MSNDKLLLTEEEKAVARQRLSGARQARDNFTIQRNTLIETEAPDDAAYDLRKAGERGVPRVPVMHWRFQSKVNIFEFASDDISISVTIKKKTSRSSPSHFVGFQRSNPC